MVLHLLNGTSPGVLANGVVSRFNLQQSLKVSQTHGQVVEENSFKKKRVEDEKDTAIITSMLESVINGGTGGNAAIGRPSR